MLRPMTTDNGFQKEIKGSQKDGEDVNIAHSFFLNSPQRYYTGHVT